MYASGPPGSVPRRVNVNPNAGVLVGGVPSGPQPVGGNVPMRGEVRHSDMREIRGGNVGISQMNMGGGGNPNVVVQNPGQPPMGGGNAARVVEMLESAKNEFESVLQQLNISKIENMELERKITAQVAEMDQIQQTIKALEQSQRRLRQQYEDDIMRLRRQLEGGKMPMAPPPQKRGRDEVPPSMPPLQVNTGQPMISSRGPRGNSPIRVAPVPSMGRPAGLEDRPRDRPMQHPSGPERQDRPMNPPLAPLEGSLHTPTGRGRMPGLSSRAETESRPNDRELRSDRDGAHLKNDDRSRVPLQGPQTRNMGEDSASSSPVMKKSKSLGSTDGKSSKNGNSSGQPNGSASAAPAGPAPNLPSPAPALPSTSQKMHHLNKINSSDGPSNGGHDQSGPSTPPSSNGSGAPSTGASTPSNGNNFNNANKQSKVKWALTYSNKGPGYTDPERPVVEMFHTLDHQSVVCCVRFSADGTKLASGCHKTAQVFDVQTGARTFWVQRPAVSGNAQPANEAEDAYVRAVCFSPDGKKLVAGMPQNTIRIWDMESNEEAPPLVGHDAEIYSLDYVNNFIVSGSGDRKVRLWDARTGQCQAIFGNESGGPADGVTNVALSPDGRLLAAASLDKVVRIWDTQTTQLMDRLEGHCDSVYSLAFSPDGKNIISGSLDKNIMLWDVSASGRTTTRPRMLFQGHKDFVLSVAYTPDGRWIMSGSKDRSVIFWDPRTARSVLTVSGYRNSVINVHSSPASPHFATGSGDCFACIWKYQCQTI
ncbi:hypothetical protein AC1031_001372 [Aphanomyces cochlioides]|nr:hypothetical protein AC1031_001372 [Aphanomyces cochlioides]